MASIKSLQKKSVIKHAMEGFRKSFPKFSGGEFGGLSLLEAVVTKLPPRHRSWMTIKKRI